jgi:hypothetical protein
MHSHICKIENNDFELLGSRHNPVDALWPPWTLVICRKCSKIQEWQIHSQEGMHGGALSCTAFPGNDYVESQYGLDESTVAAIVAGQRRPREYDWHKATYIES